ncbi:MAG: response regulator [Phycisphaerales bacterium]|jgi:two-component system phosphate regulon response regulator PhoB
MALAPFILIVDDERDLVELVGYNLRKAGFDIAVAFTGRQALESVARRAPDLILLDVMLPELSGTEVASRIRSNPQTASIPIIMLTAKSEEVDQIVGLTVGADDYIPKPFSMKVLTARVQALLRRVARSNVGDANLRFGDLSINLETHEVLLADEPVKLTLTEFKLLAALAQESDKVLNRQRLIAKAMGAGVTVTERTIDVHMTSIRKKLGAASGIIKTIRGVGYRLTNDADDRSDDRPDHRAGDDGGEA